MRMYHIAICDDNRLQNAEAELAVETLLVGETEISCFFSAEELRAAVGEGARFDILLMDIKLPDENGITLVGELFPPGCGTQIIYVTAYLDYCTSVYQTEHLWFLTKPLDAAMLKNALCKAVDKLKEARLSRVPVRFGNNVHLLLPGEILYAESDKRRLHITTSSGELLTYQTLEQFAEGLDGRFLPCHKSYLVNMEHVRAMESDRFVMDNQVQIPISRQRYGAARRRFLDYIGEKL